MTSNNQSFPLCPRLNLISPVTYRDSKVSLLCLDFRNFKTLLFHVKELHNLKVKCIVLGEYYSQLRCMGPIFDLDCLLT